MSLVLTAFDHELNPRANKLLSVAQLVGLDVGFVGDEAPADDTPFNPMARNPALKTEDGWVFESNAIIRHLARASKVPGVYGTTPDDTSMVDAWLDFAMDQLDAHAFYFLFVTFGFAEKCADKIKANTAALTDAFAALETQLETRTYLVGECMTVADIAVAFGLDVVLRYSDNAEFFKSSNVIRFYRTIWNSPAVQAALASRSNHGGAATAPQ